MSLGLINSENNSKNLLCTWKNCIEEGRNSLKDKYGIEWAFLCDKHNKELNDSIDSKDPKKYLEVGYWQVEEQINFLKESEEIV